MRILVAGVCGLLALSLTACSGDGDIPAAVAGAPASAVSTDGPADGPSGGAETPTVPAVPPSLDVPPRSVPKNQTLPSGLTQPGARLAYGQPARVLLGGLDPKQPPVVDYIVNRVVPSTPDEKGRAVFHIRITRTAITAFSNAFSFSSMLFDAVNQKGRASKPAFDTECKVTLVDTMKKGQREDFCVAVSLPRGSTVAAVRYRVSTGKDKKDPKITWR